MAKAKIQKPTSQRVKALRAGDKVIIEQVNGCLVGWPVANPHGVRQFFDATVQKVTVDLVTVTYQVGEQEPGDKYTIRRVTKSVDIRKVPFTFPAHKSFVIAAIGSF